MTSPVKATFLGDATTAQRDSEFINKDLRGGTSFFNTDLGKVQYTNDGGDTPTWSIYSSEAFVGSEIGNITPASIGAPQTDGTGATGTWGIGISGNAATVTTNANLTGDVTSSGNATTLGTVNSNVGSFGSSANVGSFAVNAKGQITSASDTLITPAAIGAPQTDGTGATGTWGVNISGNAATATNADTVTTNANLTGPVESVGNLTSIPSGNITLDMLSDGAKPTFQNCYDADPKFTIQSDPFAIESFSQLQTNVNAYSGQTGISSDVTGRIRGLKFTASPSAGETIRVTHLQYVDSNFDIANGATRDVGIYDFLSETLLGQVTISKLDNLDSGFRTRELSVPVDLVTGSDYVVVAVVPALEDYFTGSTATPAAEITGVVSASQPPSSVLVFPQLIGAIANQTSNPGFQFNVLSDATKDTVFSVDESSVQSTKTFVADDEPVSGESNGLVLSGIADASTTVNIRDCIKVSSTTSMSFTLSDDKDSIAGVAVTAALPGEKFRYLAAGVAQAKMAAGETVIFGEFLRASNDLGKVRMDGGGDAVGQAMETVGSGEPVMIHLLIT